MKKLTERHKFDILQRAAFIYSVKQHSEYTCEENTFRVITLNNKEWNSY